MPQAQQKTTLLSRLTEALKCYPRNDIVVRQVKRDAEGLRRADPIYSYQVSGAVAAINGDLSETQRWFEMALAQPGNTAEACHNYFVSLSVLRAADALKDAVDRYLPKLRDDPRAIASAIRSYLELGSFLEASQVAVQYKDCIERDKKMAWLGKHARKFKDYFASQNLAPEQFSMAVLAARSALAAEGVPRPAFVAEFLPKFGDGSLSLVFSFLVDAATVRVAELEEKLFDRLAEADLPAIDEMALSFLVRKIEPVALA